MKKITLHNARKICNLFASFYYFTCLFRRHTSICFGIAFVGNFFCITCDVSRTHDQNHVLCRGVLCEILCNLCPLRLCQIQCARYAGSDVRGADMIGVLFARRVDIGKNHLIGCRKSSAKIIEKLYGNMCVAERPQIPADTPSVLHRPALF